MHRERSSGLVGVGGLVHERRHLDVVVRDPLHVVRGQNLQKSQRDIVSASEAREDAAWLTTSTLL
jgi:hypothetical protein